MLVSLVQQLTARVPHVVQSLETYMCVYIYTQACGVTLCIFSFFPAHRSEKRKIRVFSEQKLSCRQTPEKSVPVLPLPEVHGRRNGERR